MTSEEWIRSEDAVNRSKRSYAHFDFRTDLSKKGKYVSNPDNIKRHSFYPFIHYEKHTIKYSKKKGRKVKRRDICYAAHIDRCIYQYYSFILNSLYNERVQQDGISAAAVAYRTNLHESNVHISKRAFDFLKSKAPAYVMIGDFTGFFDNLDHEYLKVQWCSLLGVERLPSDHFAVYRSITNYSTWELEDLLQLNGIENTRAGYRRLNAMNRILTPEQFRENRAYIKKHTETYGIPQGSPISGILANMYMLEVDKRINDVVSMADGMYIRYSDDFMIILPDSSEVDNGESLKRIIEMIRAPKLILEPDKTQYFYYENGSIVNCGKTFHENADNSSRTINFLGFSFDGQKVRIRAKTVSKYYYRMYRKANNIVKMGWVTPDGKRISAKNLYSSYSQKGAKTGSGNFFTYVDRAVSEYGSDEGITQDTRRHMQKIRKVLKRKTSK